MRALLLPIADELYAVDLRDLQAVVGEPGLFPIPTAPRGVLGAINVRGDIVVVLDTAQLLGLGQLDSVAFVAVVDHPMGSVALAAEGRPVTVQLGDQVAGADLAGIVGSFSIDGTLATLIDIRSLLAAAA